MRDDDGHVDVKSEVGDDPYIGTASGGMIGPLVGIIGGPLGVLIGGATSVLVGSLSTSTTSGPPIPFSVKSRSRFARHGRRSWCR